MPAMLFTAILGLALLGSPQDPSTAIGPRANADSAAALAPGMEASSLQAQSSPSGLPPRAAPPRTMEAQWPVFAAFAVSWLAIVGYLLAVGRRARRLARRMDALEGRR